SSASGSSTPIDASGSRRTHLDANHGEISMTAMYSQLRQIDHSKSRHTDKTTEIPHSRSFQQRLQLRMLNGRAPKAPVGLICLASPFSEPFLNVVQSLGIVVR